MNNVLSKAWPTSSVRILNRTKTIITLAATLFIIHYSLFPALASAVCPICTIAVVGGLGLSRYLGIDDSITGIWIGGLMISLSFWLTEWLYKRYKKMEKYNKNVVIITSILFWYGFTFIPLEWTNILGHPFNTILGVDKLIFGSIVGSTVFLFSILADKKVRQMKGKQLFVYQKVVFPMLGLTFVSLLVYFWGGLLY